MQQILDQLRVTLLPGLQADLATQSIEVGCLKTARKRRERVLCDLDRRFRFRRQQRQQRLGEAGEVPVCDAWLVPIRIPSGVID